MKMIVEEPRYWLYFFPFILVVIVFYKLLKRTFRSGKAALSSTANLDKRTCITYIYWPDAGGNARPPGTEGADQGWDSLFHRQSLPESTD
ncbi:MAG: hypothetical protein IPH20_20920 [Bacteroidales bacterium]|nr:hypothetical protein [Bacteroidales bacterium]